jgi:preprotein translocase SecE subunit
VARDRQRAKQRRRQRQPGAGGPPRSRPRDADPVAPEPTDPVAPEPTEAEFDDAFADDVDEAPGVEAEAEAARPTDPAVLEERAEARRPRRKRGKIITFLGHVVDELRRVQWPDRRQTGQGTAVTLGFVVVAGGFLGLMDALWKPLVDWLI